MSIELSGLFRAAAHEEAVAAEREFPLGPDGVHRYVTAALRRRVALVALIGVAGAVVIGGGALGIQHYWQGEPLAASPTPAITSSESATPSVTPSPTPSPSPTASASPTPTAPVPSETTPPAAVETTPPAPHETPVGPVPGQVTRVSGFVGGGSGEKPISWTTVPDATGYRVYRSASPDGPFVATASVIVATNKTTIEYGAWYEYIQIWQQTSDTYGYVDVTEGYVDYYQVAAFNAAGTGPRSPVACASVPVSPGDPNKC